MLTIDQIKQKARNEAYNDLNDRFYLIEKTKVKNFKSLDNLTEIIFNVINDKMWITKEQLEGKSRKRTVVDCRHYYIYLCRLLSDYRMKTKYIAKTVNRDHSSVIHATKKVNDLIQYDKKAKEDIDKLIQVVKERL